MYSFYFYNTFISIITIKYGIIPIGKTISHVTSQITWNMPFIPPSHEVSQMHWNLIFWPILSENVVTKYWFSLISWPLPSDSVAPGAWLRQLTSEATPGGDIVIRSGHYNTSSFSIKSAAFICILAIKQQLTVDIHLFRCIRYSPV